MGRDYCELAKHLYDALGAAIDFDCDRIPSEAERIILPFGDHVISVKLEGKPSEVYVSLTEEGGPVCGGDVSTTGVTLLDDGFVLYAHVKGNEASVRWVVKFA